MGTKSDQTRRWRKFGLRTWVSAARPMSLLIGLGSAITGIACGWAASPSPWSSRTFVVAVLCLLTVLFLQVGANYADDFSDGRRGVDEGRVFPEADQSAASGSAHSARPDRSAGPARLVASGARPAAVLTASLVFWALAAACGIGVCALSGRWWLLALGLACLLAAWEYEGAPLRYGYHGWGEVFVLACFGFATVIGTQWAIAGAVSEFSIFGSLSAGLAACVVLVINNTRDISSDRVSGKRTLSVRIGRGRSAQLAFVLSLLASLFAFAAAILVDSTAGLVVALLTAILGISNPIRTIRTSHDYGQAFTLACVTCVILSLSYVLTALSLHPIG